MLGEIGTVDWTRRTNGILSRGERARYLAAAAVAQGRAAPGLIGFRLGLGRRRGGSDHVADLAPPDSALAREAAEASADLMPATIVEHNYRSFLYARALGVLDRIDHDEELLFVATCFHDLGALKPDVSDGGRCFTLAGAERAESHIREGGGDASRCRAAAEAITLHINPSVPAVQGSEAHLMHDGVLLDAVGLEAGRLGRATIDAVRARHPRLRFSQEGGRLLHAQARATPGCRIAAAFGAGFGLALKLGPWQD